MITTSRDTPFKVIYTERTSVVVLMYSVLLSYLCVSMYGVGTEYQIENILSCSGLLPLAVIRLKAVLVPGANVLLFCFAYLDPQKGLDVIFGSVSASNCPA